MENTKIKFNKNHEGVGKLSLDGKLIDVTVSISKTEYGYYMNIQDINGDTLFEDDCQVYLSACKDIAKSNWYTGHHNGIYTVD